MPAQYYRHRGTMEQASVQWTRIHKTFFMRHKSFHRFGRSTRRRYKRRGFRRRSVLSKKVASLSRKIDAEVKKGDFNQTLQGSTFVQLTPIENSNFFTLPDYGYLYPVLRVSRSGDPVDSEGNPTITYMNQGDWLGDFIGERIRTKYLYLGFHLQLPYNTESWNSVCLRIMVVQDRNYSGQLTLSQLLVNLFGIANTTTAATTTNRQGYLANADYTLLPINPQEPGRFNVMRDFKMSVSPGGRMDYYKKVKIMQRDMLDGGRIYFGTNETAEGVNGAPGDGSSRVDFSRNNIYVLVLYQSNVLQDTNFYLSIQTRLNYYDN